MVKMNDQNISAIIENIRNKCLKEFKINPELYHEIDVNRVRDDDWQIERFIIDEESEDKAYQSLIKALKWKKWFGVHERTDQYFPKEYFELGGNETFGRDRDGRIIQWETIKNNRKISELTELDKQFVAHIMEKLSSESSRDGFTLITDTSGCGLANVNLELTRFRLELNEYYPHAIRQGLVVDLPSFFNSIINACLSVLSPKLRERAKFIKREQLPDYVDIHLIPVRLNGKREKKVFPDGLSSIDQLPHLGLNDKTIKLFYRTFKHVLEKN